MPEASSEHLTNPFRTFLGFYQERFGFLPSIKETIGLISKLEIEIVTGEDTLKALISKPFILAPNHMSGTHMLQAPVDVFIFLSILERYRTNPPVVMAMTNVNFRVLPVGISTPILGWLYSRVKYPKIVSFRSGTGTNTTELKAVLRATKQEVANGSPILIFPSGKLSSRFTDVDLHQGTAFLARHCEIPIVPACIIHADTFKQTFPVYVAFDEPIFPGKNRQEDKAITFSIQNSIRQLYEKYLRQLDNPS